MNTVLSYKDILSILASRGLPISKQTLRRWLRRDSHICPQIYITHRTRVYRQDQVAEFITRRLGPEQLGMFK